VAEFGLGLGELLLVGAVRLAASGSGLMGLVEFSTGFGELAGGVGLGLRCGCSWCFS
jgi:hypothetical protein